MVRTSFLALLSIKSETEGTEREINKEKENLFLWTQVSSRTKCFWTLFFICLPINNFKNICVYTEDAQLNSNIQECEAVRLRSQGRKEGKERNKMKMIPHE